MNHHHLLWSDASLLEILENIDIALFLILNNVFANPVLDGFFIVVTDFDNWILPALFACGFFIYYERKKALLIIGLALLTVAITDPLCYRVLKPFFGRLRPCHPREFIEGGRFLLGLRTSLSFPSAHAMNIFAQAALFGWFYPGRIIWFALFAGIIGYSRIYVGVHFPFDAAAGAVFGICAGSGVFLAFYFTKRNLTAKQERAGSLDSPN
ncbi:MAG: phosphatase PAP2 family protein [Chitinivibrionales bacterium]|nr:phosphatase PAP2 family protein [Chitinivibrionales bacterium]